jgi:hypothetical protein
MIARPDLAVGPDSGVTMDVWRCANGRVLRKKKKKSESRLERRHP